MSDDPTDTIDTVAPPIDRHGGHFPKVRSPRIVLRWMLRLRWIAVVGQLTATIVALLLGMKPAVAVVGGVVGLTAVSNIFLYVWLRGRPIPTKLVLAIILADMSLLTVLLHATGGIENPFRGLYLVHVVIAVTVLGGLWTWIVVAAAGVMYGILLAVPPVPLVPGGHLPFGIGSFGAWVSLVLIAVLICYFSGRVNRSLRWREVHINALRERHARNERLHTLTTLAAGAAHELGTPLATIAVVARELELGIAQLAGSEDMAEDARLIRQECDRCRFILDRMRVDVASDPRAGRVPIDELLARLDEHLREHEKQRLVIEGPRNGLSLGVPGPAVEQSLTVLIRNAMDADPSGQPVRMVIRPTPNTIAFDVIDRGQGMSADVLKRAGEPFFTTKEAGRGMGLGLFLVRLVAENYRGRFLMSSKIGEGTQITLELPQATRRDA